MSKPSKRKGCVSRLVTRAGTIRWVARGEKLPTGSRVHLRAYGTKEEALDALRIYLETGRKPDPIPKDWRKDCVKVASGLSWDPETVRAVKAQQEERRRARRAQESARINAYQKRKRAEARLARGLKAPLVPRVYQSPKPAETKLPRNERSFATVDDWKRLYQERYAA